MRGLVLAILCLAGVSAWAGEVLRGEVGRDGDAYTMDFELRIAEHAAQVLPILADYRRFTELNDSVKESTRLGVGPAGERIRTVTNACVLFFCKEIVQITDIRSEGEDGMLAAIVPGESSFKSGWTRWRVVDEPDAVRLHLEARLVPDFWVPPLVGPWAIQYKLRSEALETLANLERLAHAGH